MGLKNAFLIPFRAAGALLAITGRIALGAVGVVLMTGGLLLIEPAGLWFVGAPLLILGLICLLRAFF